MIGGYDLVNHSAGKLIWHDLLDTTYWKLPMSDVKYGDNELYVTVKELIVDTGTSLTLIPTRDFNALVTLISDSNPKLEFYRLKNGLSASICTREDFNTFEDISFRVDNVTYQLPKSAYV